MLNVSVLLVKRKKKGKKKKHYHTWGTPNEHLSSLHSKRAYQVPDGTSPHSLVAISSCAAIHQTTSLAMGRMSCVYFTKLNKKDACKQSNFLLLIVLVHNLLWCLGHLCYGEQWCHLWWCWSSSQHHHRTGGRTSSCAKCPVFLCGLGVLTWTLSSTQRRTWKLKKECDDIFSVRNKFQALDISSYGYQ